MSCLSVGVFVCYLLVYLLMFICLCVCLLAHLSVSLSVCLSVSVFIGVLLFVVNLYISIRLLSRLALPICLNYLYMINVVQLSHLDESVPTTAFTKVCSLLELLLHCIL